MSYDDLAVSDDGPIGRITLDRPPANVMSEGTIGELIEAFAALDTDERKAIVVDGGEAGMFSGGVEVEDHLGDALPGMIELFGELFATMRDLGTVTIASVDGAALGGGCELVAGCDMAVASTESRFGQPEINLGTFPPIATVLFPAIMGEKRAFELVMTGEDVDAEAAERIGLVNEVVPPEELESATTELAESVAAKSGLVLGMARQAFYDVADQPTYEAAVEAANQHTIDITSTEDGQEGLRAFMEDREPEWQY
ncbi:MAG: enoyl-CoA hydratase/isomerase family protein [Halobacteriales archaeon]